jgi:hypothetical protein
MKFKIIFIPNGLWYHRQARVLAGVEALQ